MEDRRKNLADRRKRARDRRKNDEILKSIATLLFRTVVMLLLVLIIWNLSDTKIMLTDVLNQQNTIVLELDKQSIDAEQEISSQVDSKSLTPNERDLVERVVAAEARGEDLQTMMGVAQVIRDRSIEWDMAVADVVFASGQFAPPYGGEILDEIHLAVANVFDGHVSVLEIPTTHFYDDSISDPYWTSSKESRGSLGRMEFWY
jgi:hypothetical protein